MLNEAQAKSWLYKYEERNSDLPVNIRRLLGLFALTRKTTAENVWGILGYETSVLHRDESRRWWLVLYYSGAARHWSRFQRLAETQGTPEAWRWLKDRVSKTMRNTIVRRLGTQPWRVTTKWRERNVHADGQSRRIRHGRRWFRMGTWYNHSIWTHLLVEGKSLDHRREYIHAWQRKIRKYARLVERECYHRVDPDEMTVPEALQSTADYVQVRLKEITGRKVLGLPVVAWFLTTDIPKNERYWVSRKKLSPWRNDARRRRGAKRRLRAWR